jgi:hypothetical protein
MLIVADSSALIALAICDGLDVILQVYDDLKIPEAVYAEILRLSPPSKNPAGTHLRDFLFYIISLVIMNSGVISKLSNLGRRRSVL